MTFPQTVRIAWSVPAGRTGRCSRALGGGVAASSPTSRQRPSWLVLPPPRVRVLSPVQALQVAITLALRGADRAAGLLKMAILTADEDVRLALRVFLLTLLARCPGHLEPADKDGSKLALEDLLVRAGE